MRRRVEPGDDAERVAAAERWLLLPPNLFGDLDHFAHLRPLLLLGQHIAFFRAGETTLRTQRQLLKRGEFRRLIDPALDGVLALQGATLRRDDADHRDLLAFRQEPQRLEAAGALAVVLEEVAVVVACA